MAGSDTGRRAPTPSQPVLRQRETRQIGVAAHSVMERKDQDGAGGLGWGQVTDEHRRGCDHDASLSDWRGSVVLGSLRSYNAAPRRNLGYDSRSLGIWLRRRGVLRAKPSDDGDRPHANTSCAVANRLMLIYQDRNEYNRPRTHVNPDRQVVATSPDSG